MGYKTPRGRQIDFSVEESFALMGRIWRKDPKRDAYSTLRLCESIDNLPQLISYVLGLTATLMYENEPWTISVALAIGALIGAISLLGSGLVGLSLGFPLLLPILRLWSTIPEMIRLADPPVAIGLTSGWQSSGMWIIGLLLGVLASLVVMSVGAKLTYRKTGQALGQAERCFQLACWFNGRRAGINWGSLMPEIPAVIDADALALAAECMSDCSAKHPDYLPTAGS